MALGSGKSSMKVLELVNLIVPSNGRRGKGKRAHTRARIEKAKHLRQSHSCNNDINPF
jgi:hypothetical protein